ncbi:MAG: RluA family pseudouridine synthase [Opitutales bacterium]
MSEYQTVQPEGLPLNERVRLLQSNEDGLVAIEKPAGLLSHPNRAEDIPRSILRANYDYKNEYYFWKDDHGTEFRVWLVNRLDSPTSGVLLLALNEAINETAKQVFASHKATKLYYALVRKKPAVNGGTWSDTLYKDLINGKRVIQRGKRVPAKTYFQTVTSPIGGFPVALLKLSPVTGRTHQLRIQCQKHGHPIVGDRNYGHFAFNKEVSQSTGHKRMFLHAAETRVNYTFKGKVRNFRAESPLPDAFHDVIRFRPGMEPVEPFDPEESGQTSDKLEGRRFKGA